MVTRPPRHRSLAAILLLFTGLSLLYSWAVPPLEGPDGPEHFAYIGWLTEGKGLPPQGAAAWATPVRQEGGQPPLYYWLSSWPLRWTGLDAVPAPVPNPHFPSSAPGTVPDNKNVLIRDPQTHPFLSGWAPVYGLRLISLAFGWLLLVSVFGLAREIAPESAYLAPLATLATALIPQVIFQASILSNDIAAAGLGALTLWLLARLWRRGPTVGRGLALGLALGLAGLAKSNTLALAVPIGLLFLWRWRRPSERRQTLLAGLGAGLGAVGTAGWWIGWTWRTTGSPLGLDTHCYAPWAYCDNPAARPDAGAQWVEVFQSFWAAFGWGNIKPPGWVSLLLAIAVLLALAGIARRRGLPGVPADRQSAAWLILASPLVLEMLALEGWMRQVTAPHGRLLFPALAGVMVLLALGWSAWSPRWSRLILLGLAGLTVYSAFGLIRPAYAPPSALTVAEAETRLHGASLAWQFDDVARLIGLTPLVQPPSVLAGEALPLRLCWEPLKRTEAPLTAFVQLVGPADAVVASRRTYPGLGRNPTTGWAIGEAFCDDMSVDIPASLDRSLLYRLEVGLIDERSGARVPATTPNGARLPDNFAGAVHLMADAPAVPIPPGDGPIRLRDFAVDADWQAGASAVVTLEWVAAEPLETNYTVFVHLRPLVAEDIVAQADAPPVSGWYPTAWWTPGEPVQDTHTFQLPADLPPGSYRLVAGWYHPEDETRLGPTHDLGRITVR